VKSVGEPGQQAGFGGTQVDAGHAYAGKSKLIGPSPNVSQQLRTVDLTASERHLPIVGTAVRALAWPTEEATRAYAAELASHPAIGNAFIELHGDLGAGKTTFVRHLLRALGVRERIKSPTYTVMEPHEARGVALYHFDFFRFNDPREWEDAGFRDIFAAPGLKIAEWPEKAAGLLPTADLVMRIEADADDVRHVELKAQTPLGEELIK
jgi:tRNA threonylcarbamoyladenosine biosynthesis protein TsaE